MRLQFLGAARQVTGSMYYLQTEAGEFLVDCGFYQGPDHPRQQNHRDFGFDVRKLDWVLLTHAHLDHCGLLPRLTAMGFQGEVICTSGTADLSELVVLDSAHIQQEDSEFDMKRWRRHGRHGPPPLPLYSVEDAHNCLQAFRDVSYDQVEELAPGLSVRFRDAGHILGAASVEIWIEEASESRRVVFSGDIGSSGRPILRDPHRPELADVVVTESTYGDRQCESYEQTVAKFAEVVQSTLAGGGQVIIPAFAIGRTQAVLYELAELIRSDQIPAIPVFIDSPMAIEATEILRRHPECFDEEMNQLIQADQSPFQLPQLKICRSRDASIAINDFRDPCIIISASGMCTGGRIRHHLRHHLERPQDMLLFVGYQAAGTLGRAIVDGARHVQVFPHEYHKVRCRVEQINGFSAHADSAELMEWVTAVGGEAEAIFCTHGEEAAATALAQQLRQRLTASVYVPELLDVVDLRRPSLIDSVGVAG